MYEYSYVSMMEPLEHFPARVVVQSTEDVVQHIAYGKGSADETFRRLYICIIIFHTEYTVYFRLRRVEFNVSYPNAPTTFLVVRGHEYVVSKDAELSGQDTGLCVSFLALTRTFNSGNPPSNFLSQIRICHDGCSESSLSMANHTRKRPAVSSALRGITEIAFRRGGGKVSRSSVWTQVAR